MIFILIKEKSKTPIGFCVIYTYDSLKNDIAYLFISERERNKGYGKLLIKNAIKYTFKKCNKNKIMISVAIDNKNAMKLYEDCGFIIDNSKAVKNLTNIREEKMIDLIKER